MGTICRSNKATRVALLPRTRAATGNGRIIPGAVGLFAQSSRDRPSGAISGAMGAAPGEQQGIDQSAGTVYPALPRSSSSNNFMGRGWPPQFFSKVITAARSTSPAMLGSSPQTLGTAPFCCLSPRDFHPVTRQAASWFRVQTFSSLKYRALWAGRWPRACCFRWSLLPL